MPKRKRLIILVMNGVGGFRFLDRPKVEQAVFAALNILNLRFNEDTGEITHLNDWKRMIVHGLMFTIRGSKIRTNQLDFEELIRRYNDPANCLLLVGHSTGVWNLAHLLNRLADDPGVMYQAVRFVSADANYPGTIFDLIRNRNDEQFRLPELSGEILRGHNFFQTGGLGGMKCPQLPETKLGTTHKRIVHHPKVITKIESYISELLQ